MSVEIHDNDEAPVPGDEVVSDDELAARLRRDVLSPIKRCLIGKDEIIELMGIALIAGENLFLLGPPGTAKSALVHELAARIDGRTFDYLLTRFTEPSELFGPFDLRRLREGDLVTNVEGMLPEADIVFLDELMNANSAILNSLLLALNERIFRRGREKEKLPMLLAVGASNHLPSDESLGALFDRFLLRVTCDNVDDAKLDSVLDAGWKQNDLVERPKGVTVQQIRRLQRAALAVDLAPVRPAFIELVTRLRRVGIQISDRRAVRLQRVIAASAILASRSVAAVSDLWTIQAIWDTPAQKEILAAQIKAVRSQFQTDDSAAMPAHPMSEVDSPPSAERLLEELDSLSQVAVSQAAEDELTLLATRIEWVENEVSAQHLRERVQKLRDKWQSEQ